MFGGVNVWRIAKLKDIGEIKFGELIDFSHKDAIYKLNFGWLKFGKPRMTRQIYQTFPLYGICYSPPAANTMACLTSEYQSLFLLINLAPT